MLFHIKLDIIRGLDQKFENRKKKVFGFFHSLPFSLLLTLKGSTEGIKWRRYGRFWATWGPCVMTSYDIDHGLPKSCLGPYFMFLTFFMEYLTYSGRAAKSTWREKSEKMAKKRAGKYYAHPGIDGFLAHSVGPPKVLSKENGKEWKNPKIFFSVFELLI